MRLHGIGAELVLNHGQQFDASQLQYLDQHCTKSSQIISLYWSRAPLSFCLPGQTLVPFT